MKTDCEIIKDLLPLYAEHMTSEKSNEMIEEHLNECEECRKQFDDTLYDKPSVSFSNQTDAVFTQYVQESKKKNKKKTVIIVIVAVVLSIAVELAVPLGFLALLFIFDTGAEIETNTDISRYEDYIGKNAVEPHNHKWDMDESIFPEHLTKEMTVEDYQTVYYNPWDAQWLSYLVVDYPEEEYKKELKRLHDYKSTTYKGFYGAKGFDSKYDLAAMYADSYNGFVYALDAHEGRIIYVELIFCNYQFDFDYEEMIPKDYLPVGFYAGRNSNNRVEIGDFFVEYN